MKNTIVCIGIALAAIAGIIIFVNYSATPVGDGGRLVTRIESSTPTETAKKAPVSTLGYRLREKTETAKAQTPPAPTTESQAKIRNEQRERSLKDGPFQAATRELMLSSVTSIVANVPMFGSSALLSNEVRVTSQMWGDDLQSTAETADRTRFLLDNGAVRKIEVLSVLPQGAMEPDATPEQRQNAMASMRSAPEKQWSDDEVRGQFDSIAAFFGITPEELAAGYKVERTKVSTAQPLQHSGGPPVPANQARPGTDAFITVTLNDPTDPEVAMFRVKFRTEVTSSGLRLSVVELINQNFKLVDPAFGNLAKRFF